ncbi:MAG: rod shape-determining protein MreC [Oscillospiraceae bacterium]|jgi:rod shape-determining protein MreC|nr:rod shape-determining protein MreC [Oscillospiraceae bacterium]
MKDIFKGRSFKIVIASTIIIIGIMMYSASVSGEQNALASIATFITTPIQKLSALISGGIGSFTNQFEDVDSIKAENELLEKKVRELIAQTVDYDDIKQENERLREILGLKEANPDYAFLDATVISRDTTDVFHTFIIDKGSLQDVSLYDPVITQDGLVGYVSQVGPVSCKVTTILSTASSIGAVDRRTRDGGVLSGNLEMSSLGNAKLSYLARDCDVAVGDIIVTSGLGGIFPKNLVIGEVLEIKPEAQDISLYAIIKPRADIVGCTEVYIITNFEGQGAVVDGELADIMPPQTQGDTSSDTESTAE